MYYKIQIVIDAAAPVKLADFWAFALDYVLEPPPHGFETWEDFGRSIGLPEFTSTSGWPNARSAARSASSWSARRSSNWCRRAPASPG